MNLVRREVGKARARSARATRRCSGVDPPTELAAGAADAGGEGEGEGLEEAGQGPGDEEEEPIDGSAGSVSGSRSWRRSR